MRIHNGKGEPRSHLHLGCHVVAPRFSNERQVSEKNIQARSRARFPFSDLPLNGRRLVWGLNQQINFLSQSAATHLGYSFVAVGSRLSRVPVVYCSQSVTTNLLNWVFIGGVGHSFSRLACVRDLSKA